MWFLPTNRTYSILWDQKTLICLFQYIYTSNLIRSNWFCKKRYTTITTSNSARHRPLFKNKIPITLLYTTKTGLVLFLHPQYCTRCSWRCYRRYNLFSCQLVQLLFSYVYYIRIYLFPRDDTRRLAWIVFDKNNILNVMLSFHYTCSL